MVFREWAHFLGMIKHPEPNDLDPKGRIHTPIGIPNTLDVLKTFVEPEGCFSPGVGSYGIYFWLWHAAENCLLAAGVPGVQSEFGLPGDGSLIPWTRWRSGSLEARTEVCQVACDSGSGGIQVVGVRVTVSNIGTDPVEASLYVALRGVGPAGWWVNRLAVSEEGDMLLVDERAAVVSEEQPSAAGVMASDGIRAHACRGSIPGDREAASDSGDCSGALRLDLTLAAGGSRTMGIVCPVLPGRRAVRHRWDGVSPWAQLDLAVPNPEEGGLLQPDPGPAYYRSLCVERLFRKAEEMWRGLVGRVALDLPEQRWREAFGAILGHVAMAMNEGAPDVAVVNYNVFNRDGVYVVNMLQKAGLYHLASQGIDYFLSHPFNGRAYPEADNPGQILWVMGEHWKFTRDRAWLDRLYPSVRKIAAMIRYYRTTPGPHRVCMTSLEFGDAIPRNMVAGLEPGRCDGTHPEYTEAFDIAGLRGAAVLADAVGNETDAEAWAQLADFLHGSYELRFGEDLAQGYGSYCVLWPCRLYPLREGRGRRQFSGKGAHWPESWRYFPLADAHQGLVTGNRDAGYGTLALHFAHPQMQGWYAFDEGGRSGSGGWGHLRTTWNGSVAMPHGWAVAEFWLLLRDCLLFEDGDAIVLFGGVAPSWFTRERGMRVTDVPTHFGSCSIEWKYDPAVPGAELQISGDVAPPAGFLLRLPAELGATVLVDGRRISSDAHGDFQLSPGTGRVRILTAR